MAEIHFSVSSDYNEVIRLRKECEKLEAQLKKMDVNKHPDVAKALESQLKSTYDQYKEIVSKIAESEAQIKISSDNIIKNTKKIVEAQEKLSNATNTSSPSPGSTGPDTSSIQEQAKAYEELREEINKVNGSLLGNMKIQQESNNAVRIYREELKKIETNRKKRGADSEYTEQESRRIRQLTLAIERNRIARNESAREIRTQIKIHDAASGSLNEMRQQLIRMKQAYADMTDLGSKSARDLLTSIQQSNTKISEIEQSMGVFSRNVGNYSSGWNGLGMSIQQVARELPTLSMGANMFFLAISNNLPILADELKRAKDEYKSLVAQGQKATPVWKQVVSSIFSWQTALTVGITLLTVYGKEIGNWVSNLFKSRDALKSVSEIQDDVSESIKESGTGIGEQITKLKKLQEAWANLGSNSEKRNEFIKKNKKEFDDLGVSVNNVYDAENLLVKNTSNFIEALKLRAKASAAQKLAAEQYELAIQKQIEAENEAKKGPSFGDIVKSGFVQSMTGAGGQSPNIKSELSSKDFQEERIKNIKKESKAAQELGDSYFKLGSELSGKASKLLKSSGIKEVTEENTKYLKIQERIAEELYRLRLNNQQREIDLMKEGTEKKIAQINLDYKEQIETIKKQADAWAKEQGGTLSAQQTMQITKALENEEKIRQQKIARIYNESLEAEAQAMRDYLQEYGTFQQQKLAIAQEYAKKINDAQNEGEKLTLARERDAAIQAKEIELIKQNIDWGSVFGSFGSIFKEQLQPTIDNLRKISNSKEFKNSSLEEQKAIYELISKLEQANTAWDPDIFKNVSNDLEAYQEALAGYIKAQEQEKNATENLALAKENLARIEREGGITTNAQNEVNEAQAKLNKASESVKIFGSKVQETTSDLQSSAERTKNMFETLESGISGLTSGNLKGIGGGVMTLDKLFGGNVTKDVSNAIAKGFQSLLGEDSKASKALTEALGSAGMAGQVISAILGILDSIAENGISGIVTSLQDTILGAVEGILDDVFSGDIIVKPIKNSFKHMGNILDTVTFGGFSSWTSSSNAKEVARTTERLMDSNERLKGSVDRLVDEMGKTKGGWKTIQTAEIAMKNQETINKQTMDILKTQMGYHGSHHSNTYYWDLYTQDYLSINKTLSDYAKINGEKAASVWNLEDIYKLTPEQMNAIRTYNSDVWNKMLDQGKYDKSQYWEQYADLAGALGEIKDSLNEIATQTTFDSLRDSFLDSLMDMDKSAKDFSDDFSKYMMRSILNAKISDLLDKDIQDFYNKWSEYSQTGNKLEGWEINDLRDLWGDITDKGIKLRDEIASFTGYDNTSSSSQESSKKGFATASQDQIEELNGRFTAGQIAWEETKNQAVMQTEKLSILNIKTESLVNVASDQRNIADETRTILANSYLELQQINENTGAIIKPITEMRDKMNSWDSKIRNM